MLQLPPTPNVPSSVVTASASLSAIAAALASQCTCRGHPPTTKQGDNGEFALSVATKCMGVVGWAGHAMAARLEVAPCNLPSRRHSAKRHHAHGTYTGVSRTAMPACSAGSTYSAC